MGAAAWLWIRESGRGARSWSAAEHSLAEAGFVQAEVELDPASDRSSLAAIDGALAALAARPAVDERRVGVIGVGLGGTLALQAGCTSRRVRAVAAVQPRVVYPELSAARPIQPVELLLNLDVPLLALFAGLDPSTPASNVALLQRQCALGAKDVELASYPQAESGFLEPGNAAHRAADASDALARLLAFARGALE